MPGCLVAGLPSCRVAELPGCRVARLPSCRVTGLQGCRVAGLTILVCYLLSSLSFAFNARNVFAVLTLGVR